MRQKFDFFTLFIILAIGSLPLLILFAINRQLYSSQLVFWALGLVVFYIVAHIDYQSLVKIAVPFYILTIILLAGLFLIGEPVRGSIRWYDLGVVRFQPSEIAKVSTIILLAAFFVQKNPKLFKNLISSLLIAVLPAALVFKQPDLGNAITILAIWFGMALVAGMRLRHLTLFTVAAAIVIFLGFELLPSYQKTRLESFLNPNLDPLGTGYNIIQSKIAVGSSGFFGRGLGRGSQSQLNFLPEAESDFIFASLTEQLGFAAAILILVLFGFLMARIIRFSPEERLGQLLIAGICSYLLFQLTVNVSMNMSLLPVTGITLPLVSYGGSSLISTLLLLGIAFSIKRSALF